MELTQAIHNLELLANAHPKDKISITGEDLKISNGWISWGASQKSVSTVLDSTISTLEAQGTPETIPLIEAAIGTDEQGLASLNFPSYTEKLETLLITLELKKIAENTNPSEQLALFQELAKEHLGFTEEEVTYRLTPAQQTIIDTHFLSGRRGLIPNLLNHPNSENLPGIAIVRGVLKRVYPSADLLSLETAYEELKNATKSNE